jgi:cyanophycin synthetase
MQEKLSCNVALFSLDANSPRIRQHCKAGGLAAVCEAGYIILKHGKKMIVVDEVVNIPITCGGKAAFNVANVLGAVLAAYVTGISLPAIRHALHHFRHSAEQTPGRMNEYSFNDFTVMVDYAHNPHGLKAFGAYVNSISASKKVGIITGVGDRRPEDIIAVGEEAAKIFDEIIIRTDADLRGRTEAEICSLLRVGIQNVDADKSIQYFPNEMDAIDYALCTAQPHSFTVVFADNVPAVCSYIKQRSEQQQVIEK